MRDEQRGARVVICDSEQEHNLTTEQSRTERTRHMNRGDWVVVQRGNGDWRWAKFHRAQSDGQWKVQVDTNRFKRVDNVLRSDDPQLAPYQPMRLGGAAIFHQTPRRGGFCFFSPCCERDDVKQTQGKMKDMVEEFLHTRIEMGNPFQVFGEKWTKAWGHYECYKDNPELKQAYDYVLEYLRMAQFDPQLEQLRAQYTFRLRQWRERMTTRNEPVPLHDYIGSRQLGIPSRAPTPHPYATMGVVDTKNPFGPLPASAVAQSPGIPVASGRVVPPPVTVAPPPQYEAMPPPAKQGQGPTPASIPQPSPPTPIAPEPPVPPAVTDATAAPDAPDAPDAPEAPAAPDFNSAPVSSSILKIKPSGRKVIDTTSSANSNPASASGQSSLLAEMINKKLKKAEPSLQSEPKKSTSKNALLDEIKAGKKLRRTEAITKAEKQKSALEIALEKRREAISGKVKSGGKLHSKNRRGGMTEAAAARMKKSWAKIAKGEGLDVQFAKMKKTYKVQLATLKGMGFKTRQQVRDWVENDRKLTCRQANAFNRAGYLLDG